MRAVNANDHWIFRVRKSTARMQAAHQLRAAARMRAARQFAMRPTSLIHAVDRQLQEEP